jgi:ribosomal protein L11 methyltransferase
MALQGVFSSETAVAWLETDEKSARRIGDLVVESFGGDDAAVSLFAGAGGLWRVGIYLRAAPELAALRALVGAAAGPEAAQALRLEVVAAKDWVGESLAGLKPVAAGRFVVHGAHDRGKVPLNKIGIEIEAALAFGTGHHGTTRGCLLGLDRLAKAQLAKARLAKARRARGNKSEKILDLGCGTGVLAIAAARALRRPVLATDIDGGSVEAARGNARHNGAGTLVTVLRADGVAGNRHIRGHGPFDLVFANILLGPLRRFATPLKSLTAPGGRIVLSGILTAQAPAVLAAYRPLALVRRIELDGWTTLILGRGGPHKRRSGVARRPRRP